MGAMFAEQLAEFAELPHSAMSSAKVEFKITSDQGSQWIDLVIGWPNLMNPNCLIGFEDLGARNLKDARKKKNLQSYLAWLNGRASDGSRHRLLVVTNASNLGAVEASVESYLGPALASSEASVGWKLLPVFETGHWVNRAISTAAGRQSAVLADYVAWAATFGGGGSQTS